MDKYINTSNLIWYDYNSVVEHIQYTKHDFNNKRQKLYYS